MKNKIFSDIVQIGRGSNLQQNVFIYNESNRFYKKFNLRGREISVKFRNPPENVNILKWLKSCFCKETLLKIQSLRII